MLLRNTQSCATDPVTPMTIFAERTRSRGTDRIIQAIGFDRNPEAVGVTVVMAIVCELVDDHEEIDRTILSVLH